MDRTGEVTAVRGEWLEITFCRPTDCEHCNACAGSLKETKLTVRGQAGVGDLAVVQMPQSQVMKASLIAYAIPLAGMLLGLFAGNAAGGETGAVIGALAGLGLCVGGLALTERRRRQDPTWQPKLKQVIPRSAA